jgi:FKBP-type peptidyl-prolyl cis-trans isomerase FkpA/FKBP-type peptidyl-prolyl cis-trans isomerase FklB
VTATAPSGDSPGFTKWILAGLVALSAMGGLAFIGTRNPAEAAAGVQGVLAENARKPGVKVLPSGLQFQELRPGKGNSPTTADMVLVHYEGKLADGTVFDSSLARGQPAAFPVEGLIPGFTEALTLMKPGGLYRIMLPPEIAYGAKGADGAIPPNAVLEFQVELLAVAPRSQVEGR